MQNLNELKKFTAANINVNQTVKYLQLETWILIVNLKLKYIRFIPSYYEKIFYFAAGSRIGFG